MTHRRTQVCLSLVLILTLLAACSPAQASIPTSTAMPPSATPRPPTATPPPPTATATSNATFTPTPEPTATNTPEPTATDLPTETATATATATASIPIASGGEYIIYYLIKTDTGGTWGCGDSLIPVSTGVKRSGNVPDDVKVALNGLFSVGTKYLGDLYNAVYQSKLRVAEIDYKKYDGHMILRMEGNFTKPKDNCEKLRYKAQVWQTVYQFDEITRVDPWVKTKLLGDLLELVP